MAAAGGAAELFAGGQVELLGGDLRRGAAYLARNSYSISPDYEPTLELVSCSDALVKQMQQDAADTGDSHGITGYTQVRGAAPRSAAAVDGLGLALHPSPIRWGWDGHPSASADLLLTVRSIT